VRRCLVVLVTALCCVAASAGPAQATNECRGLQVCVRVVGPWVVVPAQGSARGSVEFQLSCPRGFIVGGLDAELSDRAIDVSFVAKIGSPVNPGISTSRAAVFVATYTGASPRIATFRPHIGCIPTSGGGGGPVPYRATAAFPPGEPTIRRVRTLHLRANATQRAVRACAGSERLVRGWHAVGFYTQGAPAADLVGSVVATRAVSRGRVIVNARTGGAIRGVRAIVQVGAICAGGS
jgi:hypothetical protein